MIAILRDRTARARRPYGCDLSCGELIDAGEVHRVQAIADDGRAYTWRAHLHCHAISAADYAARGRLWDDVGLAELPYLDWPAWSRDDIERACDRQGWAPTHPSRERARATWQRMRDERPAERMVRGWVCGEWVPGTALEVSR